MQAIREYMLTDSEIQLVEDLSAHCREASRLPLEDHMDHWYRFFRHNQERLRDNRTPILINYEGDYIDPKDLLSIFKGT